MSLWDLIGSADAVVVARVVSLGRGASPEGVSAFAGVDAHDTVALEVIDAWKGTPPRELQVNLVGFTQQHAYVVGEIVLAFLVEGTAYAQRLRIAQAQVEAEGKRRRSRGDVDGTTAGERSEPPSWSPEQKARAREKAAADVRHFEEWVGGRWIENGLSEDARSRTSDLESLEDVVRAAAGLDGTGTGEADRREWTLSALERPGMRDAIVIDMAELRTQKEPLTDSDLQRIARVFADAPSVGYADLPMLKLLSAYPDPAVDAAAASVVEAALRMDPIPDWAPPLVSAALARYGDDFVERIGRDDRDRQGRLIEESPGRGTLPAHLGRRSPRPRHPGGRTRGAAAGSPDPLPRLTAGATLCP